MQLAELLLSISEELFPVLLGYSLTDPGDDVKTIEIRGRRKLL